MLTVVEPLWVRTPPASYACIVMVRLDPVGTVIVPEATWLVTGMLNTSGTVRSGAATSSTTVATAVEERSARTRSAAVSGWRDPVGAVATHEPNATRVASATAARTAREGRGTRPLHPLDGSFTCPLRNL